MTRMHNPPHPGEVLREYLGDITITEAAVKLGVTSSSLRRSRVMPPLMRRMSDKKPISPWVLLRVKVLFVTQNGFDSICL